MNTTKLNKLPAPTFRWLGVNDVEYDIEKYETDTLELTAADGETVSEVLYLDREGSFAVDISVGSGARVKLVQVFDVQGQAVSKVNALLGENAELHLVQLYLGGDVVSEVVTELEGRRSHFAAHIGYLLDGSDKLDLNLAVYHRGRKTLSEITAKGVLDGSAQKTFKGTIDFKNGAVGAKGSENEDVLLMSDDAVNKTVPLILCAEEDVEGSHGASVGRIDEREVFYMQSRGIPEERIYELAAQAKLRQIVAEINDSNTVNRIQKRIGRGEEDE